MSKLPFPCDRSMKLIAGGRHHTRDVMSFLAQHVVDRCTERPLPCQDHTHRVTVIWYSPSLADDRPARKSAVSTATWTVGVGTSVSNRWVPWSR